MEKNIKECKLEEVKNPVSITVFDNKFKLKPEDEISVDSIYSALLDRIEPAYKLSENLKFEVPGKDLLSEKQAIIFAERLYISKLKENLCLLKGKKEFLEDELQEVGSFRFKVEESYDGYVVSGSSQLLNDKGCVKSGHWMKGKYDDKFNLVCEKRKEHDFVDNARIEKTLDARLNEHDFIVKRETKINNDGQCFKAIINAKDRKDAFILEGGVLLLARFLITNKIFGDFNYFSMNIMGKILRCQMSIHQECTKIKMFHRTFADTIHVRNTQYFKGCPLEVSDTYYTAAGKMIMHYWHNFNYVFHETKGFVPKQELIVPKLELMWRNNNELLNQYRLKVKLTQEKALEYFDKHPELADFLRDFILSVVKYKPNNLLEFTVIYFQKFKKPPKNI